MDGSLNEGLLMNCGPQFNHVSVDVAAMAVESALGEIHREGAAVFGMGFVNGTRAA